MHSRYKETPSGVKIRNEGKASMCWVLEKRIQGNKYKESSRLYRGNYLNDKAWYDDNQRWYADFISSITGPAVFGDPTGRSFMEASERFIRDNSGRISDIKEFNRLLSVSLEYLGPIDIQKLSPHHSRYKEFLADLGTRGVKNKTINNYIVPVSSVLNYATEVRDDEGQPWLRAAPRFPKLDTRDTRPPNVISWSDQEILMEKLPEPWDLMSLFILNTGLRTGELTSLQWSDLRTVGNLSVFVIQREKNHTKMPIVINSKAWEILDHFKSNSGSTYINTVFTHNDMPIGTFNGYHWKKYVRGKVSKRVRGGWKWVKYEDGLGWDLRPHDLRHAYGHRLREAGADGHDLRTMMGHKAQTVTDHYTQPALERLMEYSERASVESKDLTPVLRMV